MSSYEHGSAGLSKINARLNDKKYFCHLTGFLEGVAASGYLEHGEVEPLIAECEEFIRRVSDSDADDIVQDFHAELLDHDTLQACASNRADEIDSTCEKSSLNRFLGFCRGVVCDGKIGIEEAKALVDRINEAPYLVETIGVRQILVCCVDAIEDYTIDAAESLEICNAIGEVVGDSYGDTGMSGAFGVANFQEVRLTNLDEDLAGRAIVLTGNFKSSPRSILESKLSEFGAEIAKSVTGKTHFIIVGGEASRDWIELNRGTKIRAAQKLRLKSEFPHFLSESQILRMLGV